MSGISLEILAILVLILANGLFAMSEFAVVAARKPRLRRAADEGSRNARIALELASQPGDFLSTVQVGITLIGTLAGAFSSVTIAGKLGQWLNDFVWIRPHGTAVAFALVVVAITYATLIFGELVPKRLALTNPERLAIALSPAMRLVARIAEPAVRFLSWSTNVVLRLLPVPSAGEGVVTEEEIKVMFEQSARAGAVQEAEQEMVEGVFRLGDRRVADLMTPKRNIVWLDIRTSGEEIRKTLASCPYSRFPVIDGGIDKVLGILHVKDLSLQLMEGRPLDPLSCLRRAWFVPERTPAMRVLKQFQKSHEDIALVVDEHGEVEGLLSLTDLLEAIVGDLPSRGEPPEPGAVRREDGSWLVDGMMPVFQFKEELGFDRLPGEEDDVFTTLGGFVMARLGRVPAETDQFVCDGHRYEVVDMDGMRVDKVLVSAAEPAPPAPTA